MKRILLAGAAFAALSSASFAADMPAAYPAEAATVATTASDWSGFYVGIQGGYSFVEGDAEAPATGASFGFDDDGFLVGIYSGFNRQFGDWVVGIDNSISYVDVDTDVAGAGLEINTLGTTRGRVGYSFGKFMVFGAGGIALAHTEASLGGDDDDHLQVGWTAGGGIEAKLGDNWSARVEYLYADFSEERYASDTGAVADIDYDMNIVRGGVAYHF
jgi:outer membrane immunogenic protein